ncbi:MAG: methyl-accepting chemotaxis protein [Muribaculaceae bacterium]|nr:methyl-accepting chemotaxis protein [Roseburia sp.]MCM1431009.1 methyl-accepting chemotaxis protein [Muribaculaceae bacterium]MCM1493757.1 methyl-accepting chemotaxis protein [Muribaculaceae bacterium]
MKFREKMLALYCIPLLLFGVVTIVIGLVQFENGMYRETKNSLKSNAFAALTLYNNQGYGDYARKDDGHVWRGMNFDVSAETGAVEELKAQTGVDITFFYQDTAVMTSITDEGGRRWIGMQAGDNIKTYTLAQGAQLWYKNIEIDNKMCHAYFIPITQPGDGRVIGAMMASVSTEEMEGIMQKYIWISVAVCALMLLAVGAFVIWYIGGMTRVLHDVRRVLFKVANGDLSDERLTTMPRRRDEFGDLVTCTEQLRMKIHHILNDIQDGTVRLSGAIAHLNQTSDNTISSAQAMNRSVGDIRQTASSQRDGTILASDDMGQTKRAIDEMLQQIGDINHVSFVMAELAGKSCEILGQLEESSRDAQLLVEDIRTQTEQTNDSVQKIKSVTEYITNISEETNLLALNASIEAARAGEAGKGFAVVAEQIRKLAEQSNSSAAQIDLSIQSLVSQTEQNMTSMRSVESALRNQEDKVSQTREIFDSLNENILLVTDKERGMQKNVDSINVAKDSVSQIISELARSAESNVTISDNAASETEQMMQEIQGMTSLTMDLRALADNLQNNLQDFLG